MILRHLSFACLTIAVLMAGCGEAPEGYDPASASAQLADDGYAGPRDGDCAASEKPECVDCLLEDNKDCQECNAEVTGDLLWCCRGAIPRDCEVLNGPDSRGLQVTPIKVDTPVLRTPGN